MKVASMQLCRRTDDPWRPQPGLTPGNLAIGVIWGSFGVLLALLPEPVEKAVADINVAVRRSLRDNSPAIEGDLYAYS